MSNFSEQLAKLHESLKAFPSIDLEGLNQAALLNRIDDKFVLPMKDLPEVMKELSTDYYILEIDGKRMHAYESFYMDTHEFQLYHNHHNKKAHRLKVRYRRYLDSGLLYFEVKAKVKGSRTDKVRLQLLEIPEELNQEQINMLSELDPQLEGLEFKLKVYFSRITLMHKNGKERITLDVGVKFDNHKEVREYNDIVIAEVKREKSGFESPVLNSFRRRHYEDVPFSKYSTGIAMMENVKNNAFKPNIIKINRIVYGQNSN